MRIAIWNVNSLKARLETTQKVGVEVRYGSGAFQPKSS